MLAFEPYHGSLEQWGQLLDGFQDRQLFQTPAWIRFIAATQKASPVVAVLKDGSDVAGYFAGLVVRKFGLRILGSPFEGWTTPYMGVRLLDGVSHRDALEALWHFAWKQLGCVHLELSDRVLRHEDAAGTAFHHGDFQSFEIDLSQSEETLFKNMSPACRRCIRKAEKVGVRIEEACDEEFADDYYAQLNDVFAKQSRVPTYPKRRVVELVRHLLPTGNLLLLRARDPDGRCIATGIFPAFNKHMYFWGGASWRSHQILRPNEAIQFYAMRYWKARGISYYDMGGGGEYKRKYGGSRIVTPTFRISKYPVLGRMRNTAYRLFKVRTKVLGRLRAWRGAASPAVAESDD